MTRRYRAQFQFQAGLGSVIGPDPEQGGTPRGISLMPNPFSCCGLSTLTGFGNIGGIATFDEKAAFLASIFSITSGRTHFVFVVNPQQKHGEDYKAMIEAGAKKIADFPNLQGGGHTGYLLEMYMWNPNDGIGKFYDRDGVAFTIPPPTTPEVKAAPAAPPIPDKRMNNNPAEAWPFPNPPQRIVAGRSGLTSYIIDNY